MVPAPESADDASDPDMPTAAIEEVVSKRAAVPDRTATAPAPQYDNNDPGMLFERNDFDQLLKPALEKKVPVAVANPSRPSRPASAPGQSAPQRPSPMSFDFTAPSPPALEPVDLPAAHYAATAPPRRSGILLTPIKMVLLAMFVMGGMASAFGGGLLLGWFLKKS